jgi:hypothetical protein
MSNLKYQAKPPPSISSQKPMITLDAWESLVALDAEQLHSVEAWKTQSEQKPLPLKVSQMSICVIFQTRLSIIV